MGQIEKRSAELRKSIDHTQAELEQALVELKQVSQERLSLRHYMTTEPWKWLLRASALGLLLGIRAARAG